MAIKIYEQFAPFANPADGDYPYGSIKNDSIPGAEDGTPLDAVWANDYAGFDAALLAEAGIVPSGQPDTVGSSQRLDAMKQVFTNIGTVADIAAGKFKVGALVYVTDRAGGIFEIISGGTPNGFNVLSAGNGDTAVYYSDSQSVFISAFGAKSEFESSGAVNAAFTYAASNGKSVVGDIDILVDSQINTLGVPFDFSGISITVLKSVDSTATANGGAVILISEPNSVQITSFNLGEFTKGQTYTASLSGYGLCSVHIISSEKAYDRNNGGIVSVNKQDILYCTNGYHRATPALYTISSNVTVTIKPIRQQIVCKLPRFIIVGKADAGTVQALVMVERNNVKTAGGYVDSRTPSSLAGEQLIRSVVEHYGIINPTVEGLTSETSSLSFCYQVVGNAVYNTLMDRCTDITGWAQQDGNFIRDTVLRNCTGTRIGSHAMAHNFTVENFISTRSGVAVMGEGSLSISGLRYAYGLDTIDQPVSTRSDYGQCWDGDIYIDDVTVLISNEYTGASVTILKLNFANTLSLDYTSDSIAGRNIYISNVTVRNNKMSRVNYSPISYNTNYSQKILLPDSVNFDFHKMIGDIRATYAGFTAHTNVNITPKITRINISECENPSHLGELYQLISDADKAVTKNVVIRTYNKIKYGLDITCNLPSGWEININDSVISLFDAKSGETDAGEYNFKHNVIPASFCQADSGKLRLFFNEYTNGGRINGGVGIVWCVGNVVPPSAVLSGGGISTAAEYFSYKSPIYK